MAAISSSDVIMGVDWREYLDPSHYNAPLHALRPSAKRRLAMHLNQDMEIHNNTVPNYGGLAERIGFDGVEIGEMERVGNPGLKLLNDWMNRPDLEPTIGRLFEFLAQLEREDILTDCHENIREDVNLFLNRGENFLNRQAPLQDETVSQGPGLDEIPDLLSVDEVRQRRQLRYDAFVCYNPDSQSDLEYVLELIKKLESPPYNFKLFVPKRDDLIGLSEHRINAKIISERCRHMIVVLSPSFLQCEACDFQTTFAHSLSPGARNKRIVPVKVEEIDVMPNILRIMACCDFTKRDLWDWSWERLARSIQVQLRAEDFQLEDPQSSSIQLPMLPGAASSSASSTFRAPASPDGKRRLSSDMDSGFESIPTKSRPVQQSATCPVIRQDTSRPRQAECSSSSSSSSTSLHHSAPVATKQKSPSSPSQFFRKFAGNITGKQKKRDKERKGVPETAM